MMKKPVNSVDFFNHTKSLKCVVKISVNALMKKKIYMFHFCYNLNEENCLKLASRSMESEWLFIWDLVVVFCRPFLPFCPVVPFCRHPICVCCCCLASMAAL